MSNPQALGSPQMQLGAAAINGVLPLDCAVPVGTQARALSGAQEERSPEGVRIRVIDANDPLPVLPGVLSSALNPAQLLSEARQQAASMIALARQGSEELKSDADNYAAKLRAEVDAEVQLRRSELELEVSARLTQEFAEQYQDAITALAGAAAELRSQSSTMLRELEQRGLELTLALGRRLVAAEWERDSTLPRLLRRALELLQAEGPLRLRLHPATARRLRGETGLGSALATAGLSIDAFDVLEDPQLAAAAYRVESGPAALSFDLHKSLDELLGLVEQEQSKPQGEITAQGPGHGAEEL